MSIKDNRQNVIASIIGSSQIRTQDELVQALTERGISVTQATLSRDIKEIGAIKASDGNGGVYYKVPAASVVGNNMKIKKIETSGQMCVLHSAPGFASAVASTVDAASLEGVMGTIAGDDTVLVIMRDDSDKKQIESAIKSLFCISEIHVRIATPEDKKYAQAIVTEIYISSQERKTGIANRTPEYICEKIDAGKAVIAVTSEGDFAGFSYIESWGGKSFVATSGLIVAHKYRGKGVARMIKEQTFLLSRRLFPDAKIFSITTGAAVMKLNYEFGFRPVPFSALTDDPEFWKGCEGCRHFDILKSHNYQMCICTGLLYDPKEHLTIQHPED